MGTNKHLISEGALSPLATVHALECLGSNLSFVGTRLSPRVELIFLHLRVGISPVLRQKRITGLCISRLLIIISVYRKKKLTSHFQLVGSRKFYSRWLNSFSILVRDNNTCINNGSLSFSWFSIPSWTPCFNLMVTKIEHPVSFILFFFK